MARHPGYLTRRDRKLLEFVERYRAVTSKMLLVSGVLGATRPDNAARVVRRLTQKNLLSREKYSANESYLRITPDGCRAVELPDYIRRPLTEHSLASALAIAWYCVRNKLTRITDREFREHYPELWRPGLRASNYYLFSDPSGTRKLGLFVVDRGGRPVRLPGKIRRIIRQRDKLSAFGALIKSGRFCVTVLTGSAVQQLNLKKQVQPRHGLGAVELRIVVVPELGEFQKIV